MSVAEGVEPQRYFFMHLQKTGGTTLYQRLRECLGVEAVYPRGDDRRVDAVIKIDYLTEVFAARRDAIRVVTGHFPLCTTDVLGVPFSTFTVLRDPVERTLSLLRARKQREPRLTLEEIYAQPVTLFGLIHNHMVKMLSLTRDEMTSGVMTVVTFDEERLERAQHNLANRVDIFGFQEEFDEFCDRLSAYYEWNLGAPRQANSTERVEVSPSLRDRIAEDNRMDVELYAFARRVAADRDRAGTDV